VGLVLLVLACGPVSGSGDGDTDTSSTTTSDGDGDPDAEPETETETETGGDCTPGDQHCACLPDGGCDESTHEIGCNPEGLCEHCGFSRSLVSPPCRPDDCPTDCVIDLAEHGIGPIDPVLYPYISLANQLEVPWLADACADQDGWTWAVEGEQLQLCGEHCDAWMAPALEGTGYHLNINCPPGP